MRRLPHLPGSAADDPRQLCQAQAGADRDDQSSPACSAQRPPPPHPSPLAPSHLDRRSLRFQRCHLQPTHIAHHHPQAPSPRNHAGEPDRPANAHNTLVCRAADPPYTRSHGRAARRLCAPFGPAAPYRSSPGCSGDCQRARALMQSLLPRHAWGSGRRPGPCRLSQATASSAMAPNAIIRPATGGTKSGITARRAAATRIAAALPGTTTLGCRRMRPAATAASPGGAAS
jgi:hypothetical protein